MKLILPALSLVMALALGGCDAEEGELDPAVEGTFEQDVPEGGPEEVGPETLGEEAVPEYEEEEEGELADADE